MGYETKIDLYDVQIHSEKRAEVARAIVDCERGEGRYHWMIASLKLSASGRLTWNDSDVGKWKSHEEFITDIAGWCSRGWISFRSQEGDGASWAYEFDGAGGVRDCSTRSVAAIKAAATRKRRAAGIKSARTKRLRAAGRKAAATRKARKQKPSS